MTKETQAILHATMVCLALRYITNLHAAVILNLVLR